MYYSALSLTLLTGFGWGLNWDTILKKRSKNPDHMQLKSERNETINSI